MPGTVVKDALAPNLLSGATLGSAASSAGTIVRADKWGEVQFVLDTGTVESTGNSATIDVTVQGSNSSTFASGIVTYGQIEQSGTDAAQTALARVQTIQAYVYHRYVRALVVTGGTAPVYTGSTLYPRLPHDSRTNTGAAATGAAYTA